MNKEIVKEFLKNMKPLIGNSNYYVENTEKNNYTKNILELTQNEINDSIRNLTINDYIDGPTASKMYGSEFQIWVFGIELFYNPIYIKIEFRSPSHLIIISFHNAEHKLNYKFNKD